MDDVIVISPSEEPVLPEVASGTCARAILYKHWVKNDVVQINAFQLRTKKNETYLSINHLTSIDENLAAAVKYLRDKVYPVNFSGSFEDMEGTIQFEIEERTDPRVRFVVRAIGPDGYCSLVFEDWSYVFLFIPNCRFEKYPN